MRKLDDGDDSAWQALDRGRGACQDNYVDFYFYASWTAN